MVSRLEWWVVVMRRDCFALGAVRMEARRLEATNTQPTKGIGIRFRWIHTCGRHA